MSNQERIEQELIDAEEHLDNMGGNVHAYAVEINDANLKKALISLIRAMEMHLEDHKNPMYK